MKKLSILASVALFSIISFAGEPLATMKYVTNQINRLDKRIDESVIPPGYDTFTNLASTALQPGSKISDLTNDVKYVTESITNGLVSRGEAESLIECKRDKEDLYQYVGMPTFNVSAVEASIPAYRPYRVVPVRSAEATPKYLWALVDTNNLLTASANSYDTIEALVSVVKETFRYRGMTYELPVVKTNCDWQVYSGNGTDFTRYVRSEIGKIATEKDVEDAASMAVRTSNAYTDGEIEDTREYIGTKAEEVAEEVVSSKGFATEGYVTSNYYDKATVDGKISTATPGEYETVSNRAMNAVQTEEDPTVKDWAKADTKPSYTTDELGTYNKATIDSKDAALQAQIEAMTAFDVKEVDVLPEQGEPGYIYLVPDPDSPGDKVNWIWIVDSVTHVGRWVKVGSTRVNLSEYAKKATTLEGYGITDAYTKVDADAKILAATKYKSSIRATSPIGRFIPDAKTGYVDINIAGMTIQEGLEYIVSETLNPGTPKLPSIQSVNLTGAGYLEVGTVFTPSYSVVTDNGKYDYGPSPTGSRFDLLIVSDSMGRAITNNASSSFASFNISDRTSYSITAKGHYTRGEAPKNNKGQIVTNENLRIQAKWYDNKDAEAEATSKSSDVVYGYRQWFSYVGSSIVAIDSELLWGNLATKRGNCRTASTIASIEIPAGVKQITFALPKVDSTYGYSRIVSSVIDIDGMGLEILNRFTRGEIYVSARNPATADAILYTTWTFQNAEGLAATHLKVTISDAPANYLAAKRQDVVGRDASQYQPCNNLNNNLNRQNAGPLDISQLFYSRADLDYYRTKGRITFDVSEYWSSKVPYPYPGQIVSLNTLMGTEVYVLKPNESNEYDAEKMAEENGTVVFKSDSVGGMTALDIGENSGGTRGAYSFINGSGNTSSGRDSHAEGRNTVASGDYSHAEGNNTKAVGYDSHAEGTNTKATGQSSHAEGFHSESEHAFSYVFGGYENGITNRPPYKSHGAGTFNVRPAGGLSGFWVGESDMQTLFSETLDSAKSYTDEEVSKIKPSSIFKVANGTYVANADFMELYNGQDDGAVVIEGTYITNATFTASNGHCTGGRIRLNGTFAGQAFTAEEFTLVGRDDGTAQCTTQKGGITYTITFSSPEIPEDTKQYLYRGIVTVVSGATSATTVMYTFFETRKFDSLREEVDPRPIENHTNSLVTSRGIYGALQERVSKTGDTLFGAYEFDPEALTEDGAWYYHQYGFSTALSYSLGSVFNFEQDGTAFTYDGGLMGADRGREAGSIKYPMTLFFARLKTKPDTTTTSEAIHYTIDGVSQEYAVVPSAYSTVELKLPKGADGKMKAGTIAVAEDYTSTISDVQDIKNNGASKVKNVLGFKNSAATTTKLATFDGSSELAVVKGENMKFTAATGSPNSLTIDVDTNKIATTEFAQNVTPYWVVTPEDTRRMSGDGRTQRRRPVFKVKYNNVDVVFGLDQMRICEVDDDGYITRMQFVNGSRVLDYQNASAFYFWPNSSYSGKYFYIGKYSPYFTDTLPMQPAGGASGSAILYQTGVAGGWFNAENITAEGLTWDEYWELKDDITDASETAHEELVAVSNSLSTVRSDRIYNIGRTGRFARYRVTRTQFGNTYVFDFELRADNKREVTTGTWYDGTLVEQKQGPTPTELTFRMIAYNGSYAGTYAFYISIDENGDTTAKMAMPTELFPMAVGETKDLSVMTVTKLSQADQVVDSYLYGDLTVRKTSDDSVIDRVPTSSEFDFTDDLYRTLTPTDNIERVKAVLNGLIEKMKSVGQIERN